MHIKQIKLEDITRHSSLVVFRREGNGRLHDIGECIIDVERDLDCVNDELLSFYHHWWNPTYDVRSGYLSCFPGLLFGGSPDGPYLSLEINSIVEEGSWYYPDSDTGNSIEDILLSWQLGINKILLLKYPDIEIWLVDINNNIKLLFAGGNNKQDFPLLTRTIKL